MTWSPTCGVASLRPKGTEVELTVGGHKVRATTGGRSLDAAKPLVVFLHGASQDRTLWALQTRYFAHHGWSVLAPDLPGHGHSAGRTLATISAMAEWVSELIAVAGYDSAVLVGHSMGSLIALELAAQIPDRVDRLVLTGTAAALPVHEGLQSAANANERRAHEMVQGWSLAARSKLGGHRSPGLWTHGHLLQTSLNAGDDVLATDLRACHEYADGPAAAAAVRCPVLVVTGEEDRMVARDGTTQLLHLLGDNARTVEIASGHSMMIESPDAFLDALIEFLQQ